MRKARQIKEPERDPAPEATRGAPAVTGAALNLVKLCVGASSIADLQEHIAGRLARARAEGRALEVAHVTRMVPTRAAELLDGGSLYWVIAGMIAARQRLAAIRPFRDAAGVGRCALVLDPRVVAVTPRPFRPFQGWRYLAAADAPPDLAEGAGEAGDLPEALRRELAALGLL